MYIHHNELIEKEHMEQEDKVKGNRMCLPNNKHGIKFNYSIYCYLQAHCDTKCRPRHYRIIRKQKYNMYPIIMLECIRDPSMYLVCILSNPIWKP